MTKKLSQMDLDELWHLFPIVLSEHQTDWETWYAREARLLTSLLPSGALVRISHIGSTAIGGICAKPIVDILVEIVPTCTMEPIESLLLQNGYLCMSRSPRRMSFNKGYTEHGFADQVFHLHLRYSGDHDELYFRDYLRAHPETAKAYEALKRSLWEEYRYNRDGYTDAKTGFVQKYTQKAKTLYAEAYR